MFKRIIYSTHRILGTAMALLFLMWFITGLVLIYHSFPDVDKKLKDERRAVLANCKTNLDSLVLKTATNDKLKKLQLDQYQGRPVFTVATKSKVDLIDRDLNVIEPSISLEQLHQIAQSWVDAPIEKIDTLQKQDIWIMYTKYLKELPIYKIHFSDSEKHQLYISSRTGEVQQFTSRSERLWAYVGSIPHKLYIPALRQYTDTWITTLTILAGFCFFVALSGIILGVRALVKRYRNKNKIGSAYAKTSYKWHHIGGLIFGVFLLTWAVSGMMSLRKTPQWIAKTELKLPITSTIQGKQIKTEDFKLSYQKLFEAFPSIKQISWEYFYDIPYYRVVESDTIRYFDASIDELKTLSISEQDIENTIEAIYEEKVEYKIDFITEYDEYYLQWKRDLPLPVYRILVDSPDKDRYYISPSTAYYKHINKNRMARKWLFNASHYMHIKWLYERPTLWTITVWTLSLGGIIVCGTGVWLSTKYLRRTFRSKKKEKNICQKEK